MFILPQFYFFVFYQGIDFFSKESLWYLLYEKNEGQIYHPGKSSTLRLGKNIVAKFGEFHPILLGFGLDSDVIHSPNEHFGLFNFFKGIETIENFYKYYSEIV